jgi:hypothetical protein
LTFDLEFIVGHRDSRFHPLSSEATVTSWQDTSSLKRGSPWLSGQCENPGQAPMLLEISLRYWGAIRERRRNSEVNRQKKSLIVILTKQKPFPFLKTVFFVNVIKNRTIFLRSLAMSSEN